MKILRLLAAASAAFFFVSPALAQNAGTVTNHAFALGKGAGKTGFTSLLCTSAQLAVGQAAADPICRTLNGDLTIDAAGAVTFATVNSNVGSFGTATQASQFTVNAKGLITAAANVTVTPAIGSITGLGTGCATFLATPSSANLRGCLNDETGTGIAYFVGGALGTPSSATLTNATGLPISTGLTGAGTGILAALAVNTGSAGAPVLFNGALGTPSSGTLTNATGLPANGGLTGQVPIANGGTAQSTAATARASSGLNVDSFTGHGDSIYTILATDRTVGTNAAFTASRTWTLPAANAVNAGQDIVVADFQGTVTGSNTLVISRAGADTVNGGTSVTISAANGAYLFRSDGSSKWTAQALGAAAAGGVSSVTCGTGLSGGTITTSGTCAISYAAATTTTTTVSCAGGAGITANSTITWHYWNYGKVVYFNASTTPTFTTCTGNYVFPLPVAAVTANSDWTAGGFNASAGFLVAGFIATGTNSMNVFKYDGTFPGSSTHKIVISGFYEIN